MPRSRGGRTTWDNVVTACWTATFSRATGCRERAGCTHASAGAALDASAPGERPRLPAQLSARELARLPLLGQRAGPGITRQIRVDSQIASREPALTAALEQLVAGRLARRRARSPLARCAISSARNSSIVVRSAGSSSPSASAWSRVMLVDDLLDRDGAGHRRLLAEQRRRRAEREAGDVPERRQQRSAARGARRAGASKAARWRFSCSAMRADRARRAAAPEHRELALIDARRAVFAGMVDADHRARPSSRRRRVAGQAMGGARRCVMRAHRRRRCRAQGADADSRRSASEASRFQPASDTPNNDHAAASQRTGCVPRICAFSSSIVVAPLALRGAGASGRRTNAARPRHDRSARPALTANTQRAAARRQAQRAVAADQQRDQRRSTIAASHGQRCSRHSSQGASPPQYCDSSAPPSTSGARHAGRERRQRRGECGSVIAL